jgi:hypothetical protein
VIVHIEKHCTSLDEDPSIVTVYCGAQGLLWELDDGNDGIDPSGFDIVLPSAADKATCAQCVANYATARAAGRATVTSIDAGGDPANTVTLTDPAGVRTFKREDA